MTWTGIAVAGFLRLALAMLVLLFLAPRLLLPPMQGRDTADRMAAGVVLGLAFVIAAGHLLVPPGLFEWIGLLLLYALAVLLVGLVNFGRAGLVERMQVRLLKSYAFLDRITGRTIPRALWGWQFSPHTALTDEAAAAVEPAVLAPATPAPWLAWLMGGAILAVAAYTRLTYMFQSASPVGFDYLQALQWTNWLTPPGGLFQDQVYPRGHMIVMGALRLMAEVEPAVGIRVGGTMLNLLVVGSVWYGVRASTASNGAGLAAAAVFAGMPSWLPAAWERHAMPLPQEFSLALLLPALWWGYRYLNQGNRTDRYLTAVSAFVLATVHWGVLAYLGAGLVAVALVALLQRSGLGRLTALAAATAAGAALGLLPQGIALLSGTPLLETVADFAVGDAGQWFRPLAPWLLLLFGTTTAVMLAGVRHPGLMVPLTFVAAVVAVHYLPLLGVKSPAVAIRSGDFLALAAAVAIGGAVGVLDGLTSPRLPTWTGAAMALAVAGIVWFSSPPRVLRPDPQIPHDMALQVAILAETQPRHRWMVIGRPELLALAQERGYQADGAALKAVPPPRADQRAADVIIGQLVPDETIPQNTPDLFFFVETSPYVALGVKPQDRAYVLESNATLVRWLDAYRATHNDLIVWFQSPDLTIYHLPAPKR